MLNYPSQKVITVCDKCLTETCLKGQFPCAERLAGEAGSVTNTEANISKLTPSVTEGDPVFQVEEPRPNGLQAIGPFELYRIVVDGYQVPHLTGRPIDGMWHFTFDSRFGCDVPEKYAHGVAWMIANAMAVGAGFTCFGENSKPRNEFKCRLFGIGSVVTQDVSVDSDNVRAN